MRFVYLIPVVLRGLAFGQASPVEHTSLERQQEARAHMEGGITRQKQSVKRQLGVPAESEAGFFTIPWSQPAELTPAPAAAAANLDCPPLSAAEIEQLVGEAAKREDLQPALLRSVMAQESGFHPCAVSAKGAQGLMQLMPETAAHFGVKDPFDPKENVASGAKLLKSLLERYGGNVEAALSAYNAGPGRVDAAGGGVPQIAETVQYVQRILAALGR
jgi:soluble lytic murein transglycosylase-like protein